MDVSEHRRPGLNAALRTLLQYDPILPIFVIYFPAFKKKNKNKQQTKTKNPKTMRFSQVYLQL